MNLRGPAGSLRLAALIAALAVRPLFAHEHDGAQAMARMEKAWAERLAATAPLAVGATLDAAGHVWYVKVEDRRLRVFREESAGSGFTSLSIANPEPEAIAAEAEARPKIAVAADGTVHLAWTQNRPKLFTSLVRYARSTDGGRTFSSPVTLNDDHQESSHSFDSLAIDRNGRVAAIWLDGRDHSSAKGSAGTGVALYAAVSENGGASFGPNRKLAANTCQCCRTGLAWTTAGPVAYWRHVFGRSTRDFAVANLAGGPLRRVTDDEWEIQGCPHHGGGIAADDRGRLHITWFTNGKKRQGIFYRRIDSNGMSAPMPLGNPARQASHPAVAAAGERVLVSWREFDGQEFSVWAMFSTDAGASWTPAHRLATTADAADYAMPLVDARRALVVWNTAAEGLRILPFAGTAP